MRQQVNGTRVEVVPFLGFGNTLFVDENRAAQGVTGGNIVNGFDDHAK
jgi:hypothetical protein